MSTAETSQNERLLKIFIPIIVAWGIITIAKAGYAFGQWLHHAVN